jgi:AraC-like DNA-binding protein
VPDARRIGYEAAALLDRLMRGEPEPAVPLSIPPLEVITRLSADVNAIADPDVAAAMRFIREHACEGIGVDEVLAQVPVSRSVLQRRFRSLLGRSIHAVIAAVRLQRAKQLLVETDLSLAVIASGPASRMWSTSARRSARRSDYHQVLTAGSTRRSRDQSRCAPVFSVQPLSRADQPCGEQTGHSDHQRFPARCTPVSKGRTWLGLY